MSDTDDESTPATVEAPRVRTSRRSFLGTAAGLTGVALATGAWRPAAGPAVAAPDRSYVAGSFYFDLGGVQAGFLKSVEGGSISAEVINETAGPTYFTKKHVGNPKYEDFSLQLGFSMSKAVYDWIDASWTGNYQRKNGAILAADFDREVKSSREFFDALVTETTIPACDAASKEPAYLTLRFAPERIKDGKNIGQKLAADSSKAQKSWLPSNFRLKIGGLDCTKVSKVDAFTIKQTVSQDSIGDSRDYQKEPGKLEFPNLQITLAATSASSWSAWFEDFVLRGNNDDTKEKYGTLEFLSSDRTEVLAHVAFHNLGIYRFGPSPHMSNADTVARSLAELYCERMTFKLGPAPLTLGPDEHIVDSPGGP